MQTLFLSMRATATQDIAVTNPLTPLSPEQLATQEAKAASEGWLHRSLVAIDIMFNVVVFRGQPDETISAHAGRAAEEGKTWGIWMAWFLDLFESDHCAKAQAGDLQRAKNISTIEQKSGFEQ